MTFIPPPKRPILLVFDLDDTLYEEKQYVTSGFKAVAEMARIKWGLDYDESLLELHHLLDVQGRGAIFDAWLSHHHLFNKKNLRTCVSHYRKHKPEISLNAIAHLLLPQLPQPLYLVTDGNKMVQENKIKALGIEHFFKRIFITHRFGIQHAKPSIYCFQHIKDAENLNWSDMMYIGDNPNKDFVNLNKLGMITVRVLTGMFQNQGAKEGFDARFTLKSLDEFPALLNQLQMKTV
jgi:putative hydrolase of the HAD superfamily